MTRVAALILAALPISPAVTDLTAQDSARIEIRSIGSTNVRVSERGRLLADHLPTTLALPPGVHSLRVGDTDHCVFLAPRANARLLLASGSAPQLTGARGCDDIWSEVIVDSIPAGVNVRPDKGQISVRGTGVVIRVPQPDIVQIAVSGGGYAAQMATIEVGAMERLTYRLRLVPAQPDLLADTTLEAVPEELEPPVRARLPDSPPDPASGLADARIKLATMRARQPAATLSGILSWPTLAAGVTSLVFGYIWATDSLNQRPQAGKNFGISLGVTAALVAVYWPLDSKAKRQASTAGCTSNRSVWSSCEARLRRLVSQGEEDMASLPTRRAQWVADTLKQLQDHQQAIVEYPAARAARDSLRAAANLRNERIVANQAENERRRQEWQERVTAPPLVLRNRVRRG